MLRQGGKALPSYDGLTAVATPCTALAVTAHHSQSAHLVLCCNSPHCCRLLLECAYLCLLYLQLGLHGLQQVDGVSKDHMLWRGQTVDTAETGMGK